MPSKPIKCLKHLWNYEKVSKMPNIFENIAKDDKRIEKFRVPLRKVKILALCLNLTNSIYFALHRNSLKSPISYITSVRNLLK